MRQANILSFSEIPNGSVLDSYKQYLKIETKPQEDECLRLLCKLLQENNAPITVYDNFHISYSIPQISKEFDLLRVSENCVINVELKSTSNEEKIKRQLNQNFHYLSSLNKNVYLFTFVMDTQKLYSLKPNSDIEEVHILGLIEALKLQVNIYTDNLNNLFKPSDFLVSPFNSTQRFLDSAYFLTDQQENIKKDINDLFLNTTNQVVALEGKAGTGKTLLLYDYAKENIDSSKKVLIVHSGILNAGHNTLQGQPNWDISSIKQIQKYLEQKSCKHYDLFIIDEAQRITSYQLNLILNFIQNNKSNCIFGFDSNQTLSDGETKYSPIPEILSKSDNTFNLTEKIRTNKNLAQFIKAMFDLNKTCSKKINNVSILHFNNHETALTYINTKSDYEFINYTPSQHYPSILNKYKTCSRHIGSAHQVIGQEFDNIIVMIDEVFLYNEDRKLTSYNRHGNPYNQGKMLHQAITRVKHKLEIVVINNPSVFEKILGVLN